VIKLVYTLNFKILISTRINGARGRAVGCGTALQSGRSRVRFLMVSLEFFIDIILPQKLALTSPTGGGRSVDIVRSRTKATEFSLVIVYKQIECYRFASSRIVL
jgi:hypothetical protein